MKKLLLLSGLCLLFAQASFANINEWPRGRTFEVGIGNGGRHAVSTTADGFPSTILSSDGVPSVKYTLPEGTDVKKVVYLDGKGNGCTFTFTYDTQTDDIDLSVYGNGTSTCESWLNGGNAFGINIDPKHYK